MDLTDRWPRWEKFHGFQKLATGFTVPTLPAPSPAGFDVVRRQRIQRQGIVFYGTLHDVSGPDFNDTDSLNAEAGGDLNQTKSWENDGAMRNALEASLSTFSTVELQTVHYIALSPWDQGRRSSLGLSLTALGTSDRMRATGNHIPGLHSNAIHLNLHKSFGLCYKEEVDLQVISLLWAGAPVVWVVISPMHSAKFEARVVKHLHLSSQCSQFVRHHQLIVPPSVLDDWGIEFSIFAQVAGEAVRLNHQTYYYQWHLGANLSEKINGCEMDWDPPPMYQYCQAGDVRCKSQSPITAVNMEILTRDTQRQVVRGSPPPLGDSLFRFGETAVVPSRPVTQASLGSTLQDHSAFGRRIVGSASEGSSTPSVSVGNAAILTPPSTGKTTRNRRTTGSRGSKMHDPEIDRYIDFGIQNRNTIAWKYILPGEAREVLSRFRPQAWLGTSAIMETLYHLADARADVHVVDAHAFSIARRTREFDSVVSRRGLATIILIPVHLEEKDHWFLVSLDLQRHVISLHESSVPSDVEDLLLDYLVDQDTWTWERPAVLANGAYNCAILLLKEAEAILRPEADIPNNFNLLRKRYIRMVVQGPRHQDLPSAILDSEAQSSEIPPPATLSSGSILSDDEREMPLSHEELEALACAVGCDKVLKDLEGLMGTLCATPAPGIERATRLYIYARDNLATEVQQRAFVADILRSKRPEVELALQIYAKYAKDSSSVTADGREVVQPSNPQPLVTLFSQGGSLEILGRFQKSLVAIYLARVFELLVQHFREEKRVEQDLRKSVRNHENYRRRREAQGFKVTKRRKRADDIEAVAAGTSSTSAEEISPASILHAESMAYDLLAGIRKPSEEPENREPGEKNGNRETVKAARIFGSQLLAYEAEAGSGWPLWMFIPTIKIPSPANTSYSATWNKFFKLQSTDRQLLVGMVRTNNPRLWQALPRFAEHIYQIFRGEEVGFALLRGLR